MNLNGLWTAEFSTGQNSGTGVVVLVDGKILGGDGSYYYSGAYSEVGGRIEGELTANHFAGPLTNVFGPVRSITLKLEGAAGDGMIRGQGYEPSRPLQRLSVKLRRVRELLLRPQ